MSRFVKTTAILVLAVLLFGMSLTGCSSNKDENNISEKTAVLDANGHEVSYGLYRYFFLNYKSSYTDDEIKNDAENIYKEAEAEAFRAIKGLYAVIDLCSEYGISTSDKGIKDEVENTINSIKEQYINEENDKTGEIGFKAALSKSFMTEEVLRFVSAVDACENALKQKLIEQGKITSNDDELKSIIEGEGFICVKQIYINAENGATYEENKALSETVLLKAKGTADFDELIGSYSNDYSMTIDGYYICRGYMNEQFEAVAFSLDVGEISDVLELSDGFHIIKRLDKDKQYIEKHYDELKEQYQSCIFYEMINQKAETVSVTKKDVFSEIDPSLISLN